MGNTLISFMYMNLLNNLIERPIPIFYKV